jgi:GntR family transcriptional regulator, transcriptional repressor for pyruvate dehydrogenase complex
LAVVDVRPRNGKAYQLIVDTVERELATGVLKPGDRLASERELVTRFGVSRTSVREALRVLENSGLVRSRHGDRSGPVVLDPANGPLTDTIGRIARLRACTPGELVGYRMTLESAASQLAAQLRTDEQLIAMRESLATMRAATAKPAEFGEADFVFHELVAKASRNSLIEASLRAARQAAVAQLDDKIARSRHKRKWMEESLRVRQQVFDAIERGDGAEAATIARRGLFAYYREYLDPDEVSALAALGA